MPDTTTPTKPNKGNVLFIVVAVVAVIGLSVLAGFFAIKRSNAQTELEAIKAQLTQVQTIKAQELAEHQRITTEYQNRISELEKTRIALETQVNQRSREQVRRIVNHTGDDPELVTTRVSSVFGIPR